MPEPQQIKRIDIGDLTENVTIAVHRALEAQKAAPLIKNPRLIIGIIIDEGPGGGRAFSKQQLISGGFVWRTYGQFKHFAIALPERSTRNRKQRYLRCDSRYADRTTFGPFDRTTADHAGNP